ncbi:MULTISPECIES: hypothetical protein [Cupriavidus]|uniref:hypothetical protein n=1 Tax=Cupriavidus TaxID=106589 RepID=UPI0004B60263|nr:MULTISPECIES: hypothetical protein [Cupriavidus]
MNAIQKCTVIAHLSGGTVPYIESDGHVNVVIVDHDIEGVGSGSAWRRQPM